MTVTTDSTQTQDEAQIRQLIADEASAICAKDRPHHVLDQMLFSSM